MPPAPAIEPSTAREVPYAFKAGLPSNALSLALIPALAACFAASLAPKIATPAVPNVKPPAIIEARLLGSARVAPA